MKVSKHQEAFNEKYKDLSEKDYRLKMLYSQQVSLEKQEKIRKNLSTIVWVIAVLLMLSVVSAIMTIGSIS